MQQHTSRRLWLAVALGASTASWAAELAGAPPLRVAFVRGNLAQYTPPAPNGEYGGVSADIARELSVRLGRPLDISLLAPTAIVEAVAQGHIDLGFVAPTQGRTGTVRYAQTYMLVQQSAFVATAGAIASIAELDQPGRRIGVNAGDSVAAYLARSLHHATVRESRDTTMQEALAWVEASEVAAFAGNRQRLGAAIRGNARLRLLPDNIYAVPQAIAVSIDHPELLAAIDAALDEMRRSGRLAQAVMRSGVDGIAVAPAADANGSASR